MSRPRLAVSSVWLCLIVVPWPSVGQEVLPGYESIRYEGRSQVPLEELETQSGLRVGSSVSVHAVREAVKRLESLYHLRGFPSAKVEIIDGLRISDRKVTFRITEGAKQIDAPLPVAAGQSGAASLFTQLAFETPAKPTPIAEPARPPDLPVAPGPDPLANAGARPASEALAVAPPIGPEPALDPAFTASLESEQMLRSARQACAEWETEEALDRAAEVIELAGKAGVTRLVVEARLLRAEIYHQTELFRHAIAEETAAIAADPSNLAALLARARDRSRNRDYRGADEDLDRAAVLARVDELARVRYARAISYADRGDFPRALELFEQFDTGAASPEHFDYRGTARLNVGRIQAAIEDFDRSIAMKATSERLVARAGAYYLLGQYEKTIADIDHSLMLDNSGSDANANLNLRAFAQLALGRVDDAIAEFQRNVEQDEDAGEARVGLGWAFLAKGELEEAGREFQRARLNLRPIVHTFRFGLATWIDENPEFEHAVELFLDRARSCPMLPWALIALNGTEGRSYLDPHPIRKWYVVGRIWYLGGLVPCFALEFSRSYVDRPLHASADFGEAVVRLRRGERAQAIRAFRKSLDSVVEARSRERSLISD